jgi:hypothetical protein
LQQTIQDQLTQMKGQQASVAQRKETLVRKVFGIALYGSFATATRTVPQPRRLTHKAAWRRRPS